MSQGVVHSIVFIYSHITIQSSRDRVVSITNLILLRCPPPTLFLHPLPNMMSIRAAARVALPRMGRVWTRQQQRVVAQYPMMPRYFSSGEASAELSDLLSRELTEEQETGSTDLPEDLATLKEDLSKEWNIVDDVDSATVRMFRKEGNKVSLVFHCQDTLEVEHDDEGEEASPEVRFTLTTTARGGTLVLNCLSVEANAVVEAVATTMEDVDAIHSTGKVDDKLYQGPQFDELEEDVQEAFHHYVQTDCGVNTDVAAFISMYTDYKEEQSYVRWLKQVQSILE